MKKSPEFIAFEKFREKYGDCNDGFATKELAAEYAKLKMAWWGSNLVFLGIEEKDGKFFPGFNVWN